MGRRVAVEWEDGANQVLFVISGGGVFGFIASVDVQIFWLRKKAGRSTAAGF